MVQKNYKKLLQFKGFKYSHLDGVGTSQNQQLAVPIKNTNSHFLIYGSSGSGKTSFIKHYLTQTVGLHATANATANAPANATANATANARKRDYVVFGRDEEEFPASNFVP